MPVPLAEAGSESAAAATLARRLIQRPSRGGVVPDRMHAELQCEGDSDSATWPLLAASARSRGPDSVSDPHLRSSVVALRTTRIEARADAAHAID